jgi:hypothetical protein
VITVGRLRRDEARPYRDLLDAAYDVTGYKLESTAEACAERLEARLGVRFRVVRYNGRHYACESEPAFSATWGGLVHRVKGCTRWAIVRAGGIGSAHVRF